MCICEGEEVALTPDTALWVLANERHEVKNTGSETLKLATVFIPGYSAENSYKEFAKRAETGQTFAG